MHLLATNSQYFDKCNKLSIFIRVISRVDTVAMLGWLSCYKDDTHYWLAGLPSFQKKMFGSGKQNYRFSLKSSYGWKHFLNLRTISQNMGKFKLTKPWRLTLNVRAIRRVRALNWDSHRCLYAYILIFIALNPYNITSVTPIHVLFNLTRVFISDSRGRETKLLT